MNDYISFFLGALLGFLLSYRKKVDPPIIEILRNQVQILEEKVAYYKNLCHWHVEEKAKLQEIKDKFERECG
jgi:hypothetical protein